MLLDVPQRRGQQIRGKCGIFEVFSGLKKEGFGRDLPLRTKKNFAFSRRMFLYATQTTGRYPVLWSCWPFQADSERAEGIRSLVNLLRMSDNKKSSMDIFLTLPTK